MSFVVDQVRRVDGQLDRLQLLSAASKPTSLTETSTAKISTASTTGDVFLGSASSRIRKLRTIIKSLSATSSPRALLEPTRIASLLAQADGLSLDDPPRAGYNDTGSFDEEDLQWLLIGKASAQTYGVILNTLLEQTVPLADDIWYWDGVLGSYQYTGLYSIQTAPLRLWDWSRHIFADSQKRFNLLREGRGQSTAAMHSSSPNTITSSVVDNWHQFYSMVKESIRARSVANVQRKVVSPFALSRAEARAKQNGLKTLREMSASGLGVLIGECLRFDVDGEGLRPTESEDDVGNPSAWGEEWKSMVEKSVTLMETVMKTVTALDLGVPQFEDALFATVEDESVIVEQSVIAGERKKSRQALLCDRLQHILTLRLPQQISLSRSLAREYGRPSVLIRYWLPAAALLISSGTLLRVITNRQAAIASWVRDVGETTLDFWTNWVVDPIRRIIGTIRHDEASEVALMSKGSLEGDRASLERMVVQFAIDNPTVVKSEGTLSEIDIASIREKIKGGDLTPVLRAYEQDLRKPFIGTIKGDLIRALLIQIQKTKVDIEVAVGGIDSLLKSQQLVFGFIGLTPGVLVCLGVFRWVGSLSSSRKGLDKGKKQGQIVRLLRTVDRILASSTSTNNEVLSYKDHGLLLCQVHELRQHARRVLPSEIYREFLEDIHDLEDIRMGVQKQLKVVERVRWAYARWVR